MRSPDYGNLGAVIEAMTSAGPATADDPWSRGPRPKVVGVPPTHRRVVLDARGASSFDDAPGWRPFNVHGPVPWRHALAAEALEALIAAGLWPWEPGSPRARWLCGGCDGAGGEWTFDEAPRWCGWCSGAGSVADPTSFSALATACSVGRQELERLSELAAFVVPEASLSWRVMGESELIEHYGHNFLVDETGLGYASRGSELVSAFGCAARMGWPEQCPFTQFPDLASGRIARAWPALLQLALAGVHLIDCNDRTMSLALPALHS